MSAAQAYGIKAGYPAFAVVTSGMIAAAGILFAAAMWSGFPLPYEAEEEIVVREDTIRD
jgi:hypothetical protein